MTHAETTSFHLAASQSKRYARIIKMEKHIWKSNLNGKCLERILFRQGLATPKSLIFVLELERDLITQTIQIARHFLNMPPHQSSMCFQLFMLSDSVQGNLNSAETAAKVSKQ